MFDQVILSHLISSDDYARKVIPFIKDEYFHDRNDRQIFSLVKSYLDKYNALPTKEALLIDLKGVKTLSEDALGAARTTILSLNADSSTNIQWLLNETEKFCQEKAIYNSIMESIKIIQAPRGKEDPGVIPKLLQDALAVSFDTNIGHDFLSDADKRFDFYHRVETKIPFDLSFLNKITNGGLTRKSLNLILGSPGAGKSLILCHCSASYLLQGYNVLYITLEMSEEKIAERIDANLLDINIRDIATISADEYQRKIRRLRETTKGRLIIKEYPTASAGANHFRHLLRELRLKKDFVPDIICIDYLNLCVSSRIKFSGGVDSYGYVKSISEELRGLACEYNVPMLSATQMNREGARSSDTDLTHISDSFGTAMTVDLMIGIRSTDELEALNQLAVTQLKNRYNDPSYYKRFVIGCDKNKMRLYDVDDSAQTLTNERTLMDNTPFGKPDLEDFSGFH